MVALNLIPKDLQRARVRRVRIMRWLTTCIASLAGLAVVAGLDWLNRTEADDLSTRRDQLRRELAATRRDLDRLTAESEGLGLQIDRAQALHQKRPWSALIAMVAGHMPEDMWLTSIATVPEAPVALAARRGGPASFDGEADAGHAAAPPASPQAQPQQITIDAPRTLRLVGFAHRAEDPMTLVTQLKQEVLFRDVYLVQSQHQELLDRFGFRFEILCEW